MISFIQLAYKIFTEYWPAVRMLAILLGKIPKETRGKAIEELDRTGHIAVETGSTSELENAIRSHCGPDGCKL